MITINDLTNDKKNLNIRATLSALHSIKVKNKKKSIKIHPRSIKFVFQPIRIALGITDVVAKAHS